MRDPFFFYSCSARGSLNDEEEPASVEEPAAVDMEFFLETCSQGVNDGKPFFFRAPDPETAAQFVNKCSG